MKPEDGSIDATVAGLATGRSRWRSESPRRVSGRDRTGELTRHSRGEAWRCKTPSGGARVRGVPPGAVTTLKPGMPAGEQAEFEGHLEPLFFFLYRRRFKYSAQNRETPAFRCRGFSLPGVVGQMGRRSSSWLGSAPGRTYFSLRGRKLTKLVRQGSQRQRLAPNQTLNSIQREGR